MVQVRHLQYDSLRNFRLDDILLVGAQTGLFLYSTFTVIGGHFTMRKDTILVLITALASIVQTACQTMFILDASRRNAATAEHIRKKPGREVRLIGWFFDFSHIQLIRFRSVSDCDILVGGQFGDVGHFNVGKVTRRKVSTQHIQYFIQKAYEIASVSFHSHPIQLNFYGLWAWTIITHVSMPLAIFYRFHSTVCLCEIWKRAYKMKPTYM